MSPLEKIPSKRRFRGCAKTVLIDRFSLWNRGKATDGLSDVFRSFTRRWIDGDIDSLRESDTIHSMKTATVRELRTAFPRVESWLAEGELVIITKAGKPVAQLGPPPAVTPPDFAARFGSAARQAIPARVIDAVAFLSEERGE